MATALTPAPALPDDEGELQPELGLDVAPPAAAVAARAIELIAIDDIVEDPAQPRKAADDKLRDSIRANGLIQPVTVRPHPTDIGRYMLIDGERRWRSARGVLTHLPCQIRTDLEGRGRRLVTQMVANSGKPLGPIEQALAIRELLEMPGATLAAVAAHLGIPRSSAGERVQLLSLGAWVPLIEAGHLPVSFATRALVPLAPCPAEVHQQAAAKFEKVATSTNGYDRRPAEAFEYFEAFVYDIYKHHVSPLWRTRDSWAEGAHWDVSTHDAECDCGGLELRGRFGQDGIGEDRKPKERRYCANKAWWGPKAKAWRDKQREKTAREFGDEKSPARETSSSRPAAVEYFLPAGAQVHDAGKGEWWQAIEGLTFLTTASGSWVSPNGDIDLDPRELATVSPAALVLVRGRGWSRVAIDNAIGAPSLEAARTAWREAHARDARAVVAPLLTALAHGDDTPWRRLPADVTARLLQAVAVDPDGPGPDAVVAAAWALGFADATVLEEAAEGYDWYERREYFTHLNGDPKADARDADEVGRWLYAAGLWLATEDHFGQALQKLEDKRRDAVAKAKVPWLKAPKLKKGETAPALVPWTPPAAPAAPKATKGRKAAAAPAPAPMWDEDDEGVEGDEDLALEEADDADDA